MNMLDVCERPESEQAIAMLEEVIADVREGKLAAVAIIGVGTDSGREILVRHCNGQSQWALMAGTVFLQRSMANFVEHGAKALEQVEGLKTP